MGRVLAPPQFERGEFVVPKATIAARQCLGRGEEKVFGGWERRHSEGARPVLRKPRHKRRVRRGIGITGRKRSRPRVRCVFISPDECREGFR